MKPALPMQHESPMRAATSPATNTGTRSTAHYVLESLREIEVEYVFCNFGTDHAPLIEEIAIWEAAGLRPPKIIIGPHENVAIHMAGGYAIMTGRGQAVMVHVDAGTANAAMGMHNLFRSRIPVMLIAGSAPFTTFGELEGTRDNYVHFVQQPFDQASIVRPFTKWEYTLPSGVITKETFRRAHSIMQSDPKGPVYLMLPREVLTERWDETAIHAFPSDRYGPAEASGADPDLVERLARRLIAAKNPILITAYGGRDPATSDMIERLSRFAGIRVIDFLTSSNISHAFAHFGGIQVDRLADVDVGLLVDVDVPWIPSVMRDSADTFWAQIDVDVLKGASPMWSFPGNLRLQGKSSRILEQLVERLETLATPAFTAVAAARVEQLEREHEAREASAKLAEEKGRTGEINTHYVCAELGRAIASDDIVINEAVTRQTIPNLQIPRPKPRTMLGNGGGGLGASGRIALGVKLACPDRCVVQIVGDGSFYFSNPSAVYALSRQYGLPIFTLVLDNSGWAAVKAATMRLYPEGEAKARQSFQSQLATGMDFSKVAEAAGAYGEKLVDPAETTAAIARCMDEVKGGRSALLHACVTPL
jgi:acetolactate synthase I/II/III large subunit